MAEALNRSIAFAGIDIGKNSFHVVGLDERGAIVLRQKWSRGQVEARFANMPPCLMAWKPASVRGRSINEKISRWVIGYCEATCSRPQPCCCIGRKNGLPSRLGKQSLRNESG
jgi:hypothetical protein